MDARRQHRIIYQTKIRMRAPGREESVVARVQNLSANGMFVTAADLPDAGTEVQCRMTLGGERRNLRGRVAWVRPASPATPLKSPGAGIEFLELDQRDSELLTRLVDPSDERRKPVDVWFEGMTTPIRCQAVVVGEGLRLETRLPFMRLHSDVRVAFSQQNPPEVREGVLHGVTLEPSPEDGVPFLCIGVTVPPLDNARGMIENAAEQKPRVENTPLASTLVDPALAAAPAGSVPRVVLGSDPDVTHKIGLGEVATPASGAVALNGSLGRTALAAAAARAQNGSGGGLSNVFASQGLGGGSRTLALGALAGAALVALISWMVWPRPPAAATSGEVKPSAAVAASAGTPPAAAVPEPAPAANLAAAEAAPATGGPEIVPLDPSAAGAAGAGRAATDGMSIGTTEGHVVFTVALDGKAAGANQIRYSDSGGIGVALPKARPKAGFGTFRPEAGPVRVLSRRRGPGSLVRFFYDGRSFNGKLAIEAENLRLVLAPK